MNIDVELFCGDKTVSINNDTNMNRDDCTMTQNKEKRRI